MGQNSRCDRRAPGESFSTKKKVFSKNTPRDLTNEGTTDESHFLFVRSQMVLHADRHREKIVSGESEGT